MLHRFCLLSFILLVACGDDASPSDAGSTSRDGGTGTLDCTGVFDCVDRCRDGDDRCVDACVDRASRRAGPVVDDLLACAERNGCTDEGCLSLQCEAELLACAGVSAPDGGVASADLDCPGVFDCVESCDDGDDGCSDACVERATRAASPLVSDVLTCAERNGCAAEACLAQRCGAELLACAGEPALDAGVGDAGSAADAGSSSDAGPSCDRAGKPELTGPITGLAASYSPGDPIKVGVPVDQDTARVIVGVYEVGSTLYLGGSAEDVTASSTATLDLYAGVAGGKTGRFYLSVELCSTSVCTTPFVRNTYQRADRSAPLAPAETYVQSWENVGGSAGSATCQSSIPVQSFLIE